MSVVALYNNIYRVIANDAELLTLIGIEANAANLEKSKRIQKRSKPQELLERLPLISFYSTGGDRERENESVFNPSFTFDVYTSDDVDTAHRVAQRIINLFEGKINPFMGVENFEAKFVDAYESGVNAPNIYCFTTELLFSVTVG